MVSAPINFPGPPGRGGRGTGKPPGSSREGGTPKGLPAAAPAIFRRGRWGGGLGGTSIVLAFVWRETALNEQNPTPASVYARFVAALSFWPPPPPILARTLRAGPHAVRRPAAAATSSSLPRHAALLMPLKIIFVCPDARRTCAARNRGRVGLGREAVAARGRVELLPPASGRAPPARPVAESRLAGVRRRDEIGSHVRRPTTSRARADGNVTLAFRDGFRDELFFLCGQEAPRRRQRGRPSDVCVNTSRESAGEEMGTASYETLPSGRRQGATLLPPSQVISTSRSNLAAPRPRRLFFPPALSRAVALSRFRPPLPPPPPHTHPRDDRAMPLLDPGSLPDGIANAKTGAHTISLRRLYCQIVCETGLWGPVPSWRRAGAFRARPSGAGVILAVAAAGRRAVGRRTARFIAPTFARGNPDQRVR